MKIETCSTSLKTPFFRTNFLISGLNSSFYRYSLVLPKTIWNDQKKELGGLSSINETFSNLVNLWYLHSSCATLENHLNSILVLPHIDQEKNTTQSSIMM